MHEASQTIDNPNMLFLERVDKKQIETLLQQNGFQPSEQTIQRLIEFSTFKVDINGALNLAKEIMHQFHHDNLNALRIAIILYNEGFVNM